MASIFTRIRNGELPGHFVWKDDGAFAMMTIAPVRPGHALVIPTAEVDDWVDLDDATRAHLFKTASRIAEGIRLAFPCRKVGVSIIGLEVPHVHIHLIPINDIADMDFAQQNRNTPAEELARAAERIRKALRELGHDPGV